MDIGLILISLRRLIIMAMLLAQLNRYIVPTTLQHISNMSIGRIDNVSLILFAQLSILPS